MKLSNRNLWRPTGAVVMASLAMPTFLAGCGSSAPPPQAPMQGNAPISRTAPKAGMSTRQKVTLLAGAAAMYYLYRKYQRDNAAKLQQASAAAPGGKIQYYRSKSQGYIYYRDPQTKQAIIVARPSTQPMQVPQDQAQEVSSFQGYNNAPTGDTLDKYFQVQ